MRVGKNLEKLRGEYWTQSSKCSGSYERSWREKGEIYLSNGSDKLVKHNRIYRSMKNFSKVQTVKVPRPILKYSYARLKQNDH